MLAHSLRIIRLGIKNLLLHTGRSILTMLGIVFGVASVIAMLAVGEGASQQQQDAIRRLGSGNILVNSLKPPPDQQTQSTGRGSRHAALRYGLTYRDVLRIKKTIPDVRHIVPLRTFRLDASHAYVKHRVRLLATVPNYRLVGAVSVARGRFFSDLDEERMANVCVLTEAMARHFFGFDDPIGGVLRLSHFRFKVVGIVASDFSGMEDDDLSKQDLRAFIPLSTCRALYGDTVIEREAGERKRETVEIHQLIVHCEDSETVENAARGIQRLLERFHKNTDYELNVPLRQLREMRRTKRIFTIVLGCIAAISLLVGGIGIMNIMLATVTERTREIGIRRALGARRRDVVVQFLAETLILSIAGGLIGVALGVIIPWQISQMTEIETVITKWSLGIAFGVSAFIGIVFGIYPAIRAANLDPIQALRHE